MTRKEIMQWKRHVTCVTFAYLGPSNIISFHFPSGWTNESVQSSNTDSHYNRNLRRRGCREEWIATATHGWTLYLSLEEEEEKEKLKGQGKKKQEAPKKRRLKKEHVKRKKQEVKAGTKMGGKIRILYDRQSLWADRQWPVPCSRVLPFLIFLRLLTFSSSSSFCFFAMVAYLYLFI